jgi:lysophospholipase L1-like esterase
MRGWLGPVQLEARSFRAVPQARAMTERKYPNGPILVFGASYAGGWQPGALGGVQVVTNGVSGQQSFEMLQRFARDVPAASPRAVIIWGFINDIFRAQDVNSAIARIKSSYVEMIALARQQGIEPIVATEVTIRPSDSWSEWLASWIGWVMRKESYQDRINRHVMDINRWLIELAGAEGLLVIDVHRALADNQGRRRAEFITDDGSHLTPAAYAAITAFAEPILKEHFRVR